MDPNNAGWWIHNVDGASRQTGARVSLKLKAPIWKRIEKAIWLDFPASNNKTEYEEILAIINFVTSVSSEKIIIRSDSQLVVGKVNEEFET